MGIENIKKAYELVEQGIELIEKEENVAYLDAFIQFADGLLGGGKAEDEQKIASEFSDGLKEVYRKIDLQSFSKEDIRQLIQLVLLRSYRQEQIQANHQMTPDSIGILIEYLVEKISSKSQRLEILDLAVGTGNLLETVMNKLQSRGWQKIHGVGIDNDDTLLAIASIGVQLEEQNVDLYHQDALDALAIQPADLVISDLPVGYYPLDERVTGFKTHAKKGHSYAHHLIIEQAVNCLKPGGCGIFVVPRGLFESKESQSLVKYIQEVGYFQGLVNLPGELFNSERSQKSLLLVQKKGNGPKQVHQVLLGDFPSFKNKQEFASFLNEISDWFKQENLKINK